MTALAAGTSTCSRIHKLIIEGTRTLAAYFAGTIPPKFVHMQKIVGAFRKSMRCFIEKLRNHPEPLTKKTKKK